MKLFKKTGIHEGGEEDLAVRAETILSEGQNLLHATRTTEREDPSLRDPSFSENQRAYAEDVKQLLPL